MDGKYARKPFEHIAFIGMTLVGARGGYKPQLARSGNGFITGLIVPRGNASDSCQLAPMFEQVVGRTSVIPEIVSVDDGYSSAKSRKTLKTHGVKIVSISGSKGKKITPDEDWDSEDYTTARDNRSAVESLMFTIKKASTSAAYTHNPDLKDLAKLLEFMKTKAAHLVPKFTQTLNYSSLFVVHYKIAGGRIFVEAKIRGKVSPVLFPPIGKKPGAQKA